ncbi:hypothetical protein DB30_02335 [Enhygromyxa salina]|uniref:DUF4132 domain-containing protein n=2 Tax=Enhygromyxa salina TaxID=215803 RepID=A0A0C2DE30_9BACT|nr:hypothetical protein DB30_02335 [Enhygromyxa salina]
MDRRGRIARFDAWPPDRRDLDHGLLPSHLAHTLDDHTTLQASALMRLILDLPPGFCRPIPILAELGRSSAVEIIADPSALGRGGARSRNADMLVELREPVASVDTALLRQLAEASRRRGRLRPTSDDPTLGWIHTSTQWLADHWEALGVVRVWTPLRLEPGGLGVFEYMYDAESEAYRCVAGPRGTVLRVEDLPKTSMIQIASLEIEFNQDSIWRPAPPGRFLSVAELLQRRRSIWGR